jgi:Spy/CpxP family protein refolding chaperone
MDKGKIVLGIALVFILGALGGSLGTGFYLKQKDSAPITDSQARKASIMERFSKELKLTEDQKTKIAQLIDRTEEKRQEHTTQLRAEIRNLMDQIRGELNKEQQDRFDALRDKYRERRKAREEAQTRP